MTKQNLVKGAEWRQVMDQDHIRRSVTRIAHEIVECCGGAERVAIVGVRTRGEYLAKRIHDKIQEIEEIDVPLGVVDITLYRDDLSKSSEQALVRGTDLPFNIAKHIIVLVDDVLYTGRTVRAALDAIIDFGRPKAVHLAVLVDRGRRELPIRADYVGKNIPTAPGEVVQVQLEETDELEGVFIKSKKS